jgi:elongation factor P
LEPIHLDLMATANDLRKGMAINHKGDVSVILEMQHRTPGNLRAFVQVIMRSIKTGKSSDVRFSSTEKVEIVPLFTKKMEFSYMDKEDFVFCDPETYEMVNVNPEIVGDAKNYLVENGQATVTFIEERVVMIEIPASVILTVADAPEGIKGDSANNVQKPITLETGISIQAPLFIKTGEKIKVDTRTAKYMERA